MSEKLYYAGIGSRETPNEICRVMRKIADNLRKQTWTLRSGGARGADTAFEIGASFQDEIYLPWDGFEKHQIDNQRVFLGDNTQSRSIASQYHPAWDGLRIGAKKMMARNAYQILGQDLATPSKMVICWTKGGTINGGTGQAIRHALALDIPVFNLAIDSHWQLLEIFVMRMEKEYGLPSSN